MEADRKPIASVQRQARTDAWRFGLPPVVADLDVALQPRSLRRGAVVGDHGRRRGARVVGVAETEAEG